MKCFGGLSALLTLLLFVSPVLAQANHTSLLDRWYDALVAVEREEIAALLAPDATIVLKDIGVTQTSAEFVSSLDEWADAIKGGSIRHKITSDGSTEVVVSVCYTFASSSMMTTENFVFEGKQILSTVQETVATNCDSF